MCPASATHQNRKAPRTPLGYHVLHSSAAFTLKRVIQNIPSFIILRQNNKQKHQTKMFASCNFSQIGRSTAKISSQISGAIGLPVLLMKLNCKRVKRGFARRRDVVQTLAKEVHSFARSDPKDASDRVSKDNILKRIEHRMLRPPCANSFVYVSRNHCHGCSQQIATCEKGRI